MKEDYDSIYECPLLEDFDFAKAAKRGVKVWFGDCQECGVQLATPSLGMEGFRAKFDNGAAVCHDCAAEIAEAMLASGQEVFTNEVNTGRMEGKTPEEVAATEFSPKIIGKDTPASIYICLKKERGHGYHWDDDEDWFGECHDCREEIFANEVEHSEIHMDCLKRYVTLVDCCFDCANVRYKRMQELGIKPEIDKPDDLEECDGFVEYMKRMEAKEGHIFENKPRF